MKKKVCMIIYTTYFFDSRVRREAETLVALLDYHLTVITLKRDKVPNNYKLDGVNILEVNQSIYSGTSKIKYIFSYLEFFLRSFISCTKLYLRNETDIVHVHNMPNFLVFAAIIPRIFGKKLILDIHDSVPETFLSKYKSKSSLFFRLLCFEEYISCKIANKLICVNVPQQEILVRRGIPAKKFTILMNVPDPQKIDLSKIKNRSARNKNGTFRMVYHGTIAERLGIDLIIQSINSIKEELQNFEFHIFGRSGGEAQKLKKLSSKLGLSDKIIFRNIITLDQIPEELQHMDAGIIGNRKDSATELMLPVKLLEYNTLEIPVIAPNLKAIKYYFSNEMVCFYEAENIDSMANAILIFYKDKTKREKFAQNAKEFSRCYEWNKHKYDLINLYKNI